MCGCTKYIEIDAAVFAPKVHDEMKCDTHGIQLIAQVGTPYHTSIGTKTKLDPNQKGIK